MNPGSSSSDQTNINNSSSSSSNQQPNPTTPEINKPNQGSSINGTTKSNSGTQTQNPQIQQTPSKEPNTQTPSQDSAKVPSTPKEMEDKFNNILIWFDDKKEESIEKFKKLVT
ncbi:hypothetical protein, partial [Mycoplasmopsis cynos]|uniref:hypothetical protein n=1 Tax=Mycoplasmopsis cynos TaxID=171284 RepID=UPI0011712087